jgi:protein-S-isoprenylcysteine O-methyltransferase Ste14
MSQPGTTAHARVRSQDQDLIVRLGGWLFKQRSWLPIPIVVALVVLPRGVRHPLALWGGVLLVALGQGIRLWAVHHIGVISRTRSERLGPLISTGPFARVRNPLYLGNIALWIGFTVSAGLLWLAPIVLLVLGLEYHAIVRWEEGLLVSRLGDDYREYLTRVPRWIPAMRSVAAETVTGAYSWGDTLFSERSTLLAVAIGYLILWFKA